MSLPKLFFLFILLGILCHATAQPDSILQQIPAKYISNIDNKIDKYSSRISNKTEKVLTKLSRWENKIHTLLQKVNPEAAARLFGNQQTTFGTLLQKIKEGKAIAENYQATYHEYRDKLTIHLKYLQEQKDNIKKNLTEPIAKANKKLTELEEEVKNSEAIAQFIKERKKQLLDEAIKYIGKSKYLMKINKEAYYYVETLRNYKEIFSDPKKAEETVINILNKIPAFQKFVQQNSMLASLFRTPDNAGSVASLAGLQTRAGIQALLQDRIAAGGPNAQQIITQNIQQAQAELNALKNKIMQAGGTSSSDELPDFKPNEQKTKTFLQRLEFGSNIQFAKNNALLPAVADIALSIGYKLNDKSVIGIGGSYKLGLGSIQRISITHQGIGIRSFVDWKLKKQFFVSGGFEMNYHAQFSNMQQLNNYNNWQQSGLVGISKKITVKTKWFKGTKLQLLYDMLHRQHVPVSQPILFRIGYQF